MATVTPFKYSEYNRLYVSIESDELDQKKILFFSKLFKKFLLTAPSIIEAVNTWLTKNPKYTAKEPIQYFKNLSYAIKEPNKLETEFSAHFDRPLEYLYRVYVNIDIRKWKVTDIQVGG